MWAYFQSNGNFLHDLEFISKGYAGKGNGKNFPQAQILKYIGPLPRGIYTLDKVDEEKGPLTIHLTPSSFNEMFGRDGFLIHGDNPEHVGDSSDGCIVIDHATRELVSLSNDKILVVV